MRVPPGQEYFKMNFLRSRYVEVLIGLLTRGEIPPTRFLDLVDRFAATPNTC